MDIPKFEELEANFEGQALQIMTLLSQDAKKLDQKQRELYVSVQYMVLQSRTQSKNYIKASQGLVKGYLGNPAIAEILRSAA